jgi:hypothetical protein
VDEVKKMAGVLAASDIYPDASFFPGATESTAQKANGLVESGPAPASAPAYAWFGMVILLIALRIVWEFAEKA